MVQEGVPGVGQDAHGAVALDDHTMPFAALDILHGLAHELDRLFYKDNLLVEAGRQHKCVSVPGCAEGRIELLPLHHCRKAWVPPQ